MPHPISYSGFPCWSTGGCHCIFICASRVIIYFVELDWFAAYEKERSEREALRKLKEEMNKKARREARIKKLKEEHGTTRWSIKRKVHV